MEVGSSVTRFKVGDRVVGQALGEDEKLNTPAMGGFQEYTVLLADIASSIPDSLSYESASVLPLGLVGLYMSLLLLLPLSSCERHKMRG